MESSWKIERFLANFVTAKEDRMNSSSMNSMTVSFYNINRTDGSSNEPVCNAYLDCPVGWKAKWLLVLMMNIAMENDGVVSCVNDMEHGMDVSGLLENFNDTAADELLEICMGFNEWSIVYGGDV